MYLIQIGRNGKEKIMGGQATNAVSCLLPTSDNWVYRTYRVSRLSVSLPVLHSVPTASPTGSVFCVRPAARYGYCS